MEAKRRYGQHFLVNPAVADRIVRLASPSAEELVVEIGPGTGVLTERLIDSGAEVVAIEVDESLYGMLEERFSKFKNFTLIKGDALKIDYKDLSRSRRKKIKVVSNLPYNIGGMLLFRFVEQWEAFDSMVLTLQKEVVDRITARCGTKDYGVLTVVLYAYCEAKGLFNIQPGSFRPRPKVVSTVFRLKVRPRPLVDKAVEALFKRLVDRAFRHRRKTLQNALKSLIPEDILQQTLVAAAVSPQTRPDAVPPDGYVRLATALYSFTKGAYN